MRTLAAGITRFRETPYALIPIAAEGLVAGLLIALGVIPADGSSAAAGAAFPLDVYFDLKQGLAQASSWPLFAGVMVVSVATRSGVLAATVAIADGKPDAFLRTWARTARLVGIAAIGLAPAALLMFSGTASRYAPFLWVGALLGFAPALLLARRAVSLAAVTDGTENPGIPEGFSFLSYAYLSALFGAGMSSFGEEARFASAAIVLFPAPIHALMFLGWREHARKGTYPGGGTIAVAITTISIAILFSGTIYDRYVRDFPPVARADAPGTLLLLGGVDSTATTGALTDVDVRRFGYPDDRSRLLSYRGPGKATTKEDTHGDLAVVAEAVAEQIDEVEPPAVMLGHSQAALILDRLVDMGQSPPQRSVMFAPPPPFPPSLEIPPPGETAPGKPGGDLARWFASTLEGIGIDMYDVDTDAFPTNLEPVVLIDGRMPRLSIWALGDSVWLDRDWRRPGETNVVAITDHVGVVNNGRAVATTKAFFEGTSPESDEASWRGAFVSLLRHAFAPWRPAEV